MRTVVPIWQMRKLRPDRLSWVTLAAVVLLILHPRSFQEQGAASATSRVGGEGQGGGSDVSDACLCTWGPSLSWSVMALALYV